MFKKIISLLKALMISIGAFFLYTGGRDSEKVKQYEKEKKATQRAKKVDDYVDNLSHDDVSKQLQDDWTR